VCETGPFERIIERSKRNFYPKDATPSNAEALGVAIAHWFAHDTIQINETFIAALEDSNRMSLCDLLDVVKDWPAEQIRLLTKNAEHLERTIERHTYRVTAQRTKRAHYRVVDFPSVEQARDWVAVNEAERFVEVTQHNKTGGYLTIYCRRDGLVEVDNFAPIC
jgi:hypothetical protein